MKAHIYMDTYLKKSFLQKSFASLEKHLSCSAALQSKQRTHSTCHARSKTFSRYWSIIGFSHPAHDRSIARPRLPVEIKREHITYLRHFGSDFITWHSVLLAIFVFLIVSFFFFFKDEKHKSFRVVKRFDLIHSTWKFQSKFNEILTHDY